MLTPLNPCTRAVMVTGRTTGTNAVPTHCYRLEKLPRAVFPPPFQHWCMGQGSVAPGDEGWWEPLPLPPPSAVRWPPCGCGQMGPRGFHRFSAACWQVGPISLGASRKSGETGAGREGPGGGSSTGRRRTVPGMPGSRLINETIPTQGRAPPCMARGGRGGPCPGVRGRAGGRARGAVGSPSAFNLPPSRAAPPAGAAAAAKRL